MTVNDAYLGRLHMVLVSRAMIVTGALGIGDGNKGPANAHTWK